MELLLNRIKKIKKVRKKTLNDVSKSTLFLAVIDHAEKYMRKKIKLHINPPKKMKGACPLRLWS